MHVITIASGKGGSSKTTLTASLAVLAATEARVGLIDLNRDQATLTAWAEQRGDDNLQLVEGIKSLLTDIRLLKRSGEIDWLFIDTPPTRVETIEGALVAADLVIMPSRASALDIAALVPVVQLCKSRKKKFVIVLAAVNPARRDLNDAATEELESLGELIGRTTDKTAQVEAMSMGKVGFELDKSLRAELVRIWNTIKQKVGAT